MGQRSAEDTAIAVAISPFAGDDQHGPAAFFPNRLQESDKPPMGGGLSHPMQVKPRFERDHAASDAACCAPVDLRKVMRPRGRG